jgi:hypothetical protein
MPSRALTMLMPRSKDCVPGKARLREDGGPPSPSNGLAPPVDGSLELALVHLRATLDSETLSVAVELLLSALSSLRHGRPPFKLSMDLIVLRTCCRRAQTHERLLSTQ